MSSREELKQRALRELGAPVLNINVADEQLEDRIDDALALFFEFNLEGSVKTYIKHTLSKEEAEENRFQLPNNVISVLGIVKEGRGFGGNANNLSYVATVSDLFGSVNQSVSNYVISTQYIETMSKLFNPEKRIWFNYSRGLLMFETPLKEGDTIVLSVWVNLDPETNNILWENRWLRAYTTSLFKKQWGINLTKFTNATLPGGVSFNGEMILNEAKQEIEMLKNELHSMYEYPPMFFMG